MEAYMGYIKDPQGITLSVEHRQPNDEENRLFREYIQQKQTNTATEHKKTRGKTDLQLIQKKQKLTA